MARAQEEYNAYITESFKRGTVAVTKQLIITVILLIITIILLITAILLLKVTKILLIIILSKQSKLCIIGN